MFPEEDQAVPARGSAFDVLLHDLWDMRCILQNKYQTDSF